MADEQEDPRENIIVELTRELGALKKEVARLKAEGAAPTEPLSEEQVIAAEVDRRRQEAAREAKVQAAMDPRTARLEFLKGIYGGQTK
ncbi:MAG: hypothetical protein IT371_14320 [Deltaproteobacteria bacterium]|nr:hypothetical protein [Deltaproteobacteria bacterium]